MVFITLPLQLPLPDTYVLCLYLDFLAFSSPDGFQLFRIPSRFCQGKVNQFHQCIQFIVYGDCAVVVLCTGGEIVLGRVTVYKWRRSGECDLVRISVFPQCCRQSEWATDEAKW